MRTRRGFCYPTRENLKQQVEESVVVVKRRRRSLVVFEDDDQKISFFDKRFRPTSEEHQQPPNTRTSDFFEELPEDLVISILSKLSSTADSPTDFVNVLLTCKRLNNLALHPQVLSKASPRSFAIKAGSWSESSHRFLKTFAEAGNVEASYTLGMIRFYCLETRGSGASLMAKAAMCSYAPALYSLAVIQFNGSGGTKTDKDLRAGVALCARAAYLGHVDALRELGHCLQDGYGVRQNITEGRRFLIHANAREVASVLLSRQHHPHFNGGEENSAIAGSCGSCPLLSDFGCNVPAPEVHLANRFLTEWFSTRDAGTGGGESEVTGSEEDLSGLRMCSHSGCGRPETRRHEFRRCSVCGTVNYCSRACQALDWKLRHKAQCAPMEEWFEEEDEDNGGNVNGNGDGTDVVMYEDGGR